MTQVPEETPDSLVPEVPDDDVRFDDVSPDTTSRDFGQTGHDDDPASFLNPQ